MREVSAIPPWEFARRLDFVTKEIAVRYCLPEEQAVRLKEVITLEAAGLMGRHAGALLEIAGDALGTRARGEPFTPEQVARWVERSGPLRADMDRATERLALQFEGMLTEGGRHLLEADLAAYRKRAKDLERASLQWAQGEWTPRSWGLHRHPDFAEAYREAVPERGGIHVPQAETAIAPDPPPDDTTWRSYEPATWYAYVRESQRRFGLNPGQMTTAESIHDELVERATVYLARRREELGAVANRERATHEGYAPVRSLFGELQARLDALPTTSQRDRADSQSKPNSGVTP